MQVLALFAVFAVMLHAVAAGICSIIERYSEFASLVVFLGLFAVNFVIAWIAAVHVTEKHLLDDDGRAANERHEQEREAMFRAMKV